jgi:hypothetical protein
VPYKDPDVRRRKNREYARKKYHSDPEWRERTLKAQRDRAHARYHSDPEWRERRLAEKAGKYRSDPKFREDMKRRARESYARHMQSRTADRAARLALQDGRCLLCNRRLTLSEAHEDHNHRCCPGKRGCEKCIRGLLHGNCNVMIGLAHENAALLRRAADYVERVQSPDHS